MNTVKKDHSVGEGSGALAGAMAGVAVGSAAGPVGTLVGAAVGGIVGAKAGGAPCPATPIATVASGRLQAFAEERQ